MTFEAPFQVEAPLPPSSLCFFSSSLSPSLSLSLSLDRGLQVQGTGPHRKAQPNRHPGQRGGKNWVPSHAVWPTFRKLLLKIFVNTHLNDRTCRICGSHGLDQVRSIDLAGPLEANNLPAHLTFTSPIEMSSINDTENKASMRQ